MLLNVMVCAPNSFVSNKHDLAEIRGFHFNSIALIKQTAPITYRPVLFVDRQVP